MSILIDQNNMAFFCQFFFFHIFLSLSQIAVITLHALMNACLSEEHDVRFVKVATAIGSALQAEHNMQILRKNKIIFEELRNMSEQKRSALVVPFINQRAKKMIEKDADWSPSLVTKVRKVILASWFLKGGGEGTKNLKDLVLEKTAGNIDDSLSFSNREN
jgi:hypothetical protein